MAVVRAFISTSFLIDDEGENSGIIGMLKVPIS
jgi:hypothetical protein